jgi:23S rRNA pseudouridine2605 synthase
MRKRIENEGKSFDKKDKKPFSSKTDSFGKPKKEFGSDNKKSFDDRKPFSDRPKREGGFSNDRKPFGDRLRESPKREGGFSNDRKSFDDRPKRSGGFNDDRKPFGDRPKREGGFSNDRKSFDDRPKREGGFSNDRKSFDDRLRESPKREGGFSNDRKSFDDRPKREGGFSNDRKSFDDRPKREGGFSNDRKPFGDRPKREGGFSNDRKSFDDRPKRSGGFNDDRKPFGDRPKREGGFNDDRKPFGDRPKREGGFNDDRKPFGDRPKREGGFNDDRKSFGDRKPFRDRPKREGGFSNDRKSFDDRPKRDFEDKKPSFNEKTDEKPKRSRFEKGDNQASASSINPPKYNYRFNKEGLPMKARKQIIQEELEEVNEEIRLNRYISNSGLCSRREADDLIVSGQISVNGQTITELGYKVKRTDIVKYGKKILNPEKLVYILLNKPKDFITTTDDPQERRTVMDLVGDACSERVYPVGRLDRNTTGLILLTNDGELAEKLSHPSNNIKKIYQVELNKPITTEDFEAIKNGFELEDGFIKADDLAIVTPDAEVIGIEIHSGRNRIVRRLFEHLGYEVQKLDRTTYAGLNKKDLPRGKWRFLTEKEVIRIKYML